MKKLFTNLTLLLVLLLTTVSAQAATININQGCPVGTDAISSVQINGEEMSLRSFSYDIDLSTIENWPIDVVVTYNSSNSMVISNPTIGLKLESGAAWPRPDNAKDLYFPNENYVVSAQIPELYKDCETIVLTTALIQTYDWTITAGDGTNFSNAKFYLYDGMGAAQSLFANAEELNMTDSPYVLKAMNQQVMFYVVPNDGYKFSSSISNFSTFTDNGKTVYYTTLNPGTTAFTVTLESGEVDPYEKFRKIYFNGETDVIEKVVVLGTTYTDIDEDGIWVDFSDYIGTSRSLTLNIQIYIKSEYKSAVATPTVSVAGTNATFTVSGNGEAEYISVNGNVSGSQLTAMESITINLAVASAINFTVAVDGGANSAVSVMHFAASGYEPLTLNDEGVTALTIYSNYPQIYFEAAGKDYTITGVTVTRGGETTAVEGYANAFAVQNGDAYTVTVKANEPDASFNVVLPDGKFTDASYTYRGVTTALKDGENTINYYSADFEEGSSNYITFNAALLEPTYTAQPEDLNYIIKTASSVEGQEIEDMTNTWRLTFRAPYDQEEIEPDQSDSSQQDDTTVAPAEQTFLVPSNGATYTVTVDRQPITYTFVCEYDVLSFGYSTGMNYETYTYEFTPMEDVVYADGVYTLENLEYGQTLVVQPNAEGYLLKGLSLPDGWDGTFRVANNQGTVSTGYICYPATIYADVVQVVSYTVNCAEDVLTFQIQTGADTFETVESTYADGAYTLSNIELGKTVAVGLAQGALYTISDVAVEGLDSYRFTENGFDINTSDPSLPSGSVFNVTLKESVVYTITCAEDVFDFYYSGYVPGQGMVQEAIEGVEYNNGAYTIVNVDVTTGYQVLGLLKEDAPYEVVKVMAGENQCSYSVDRFAISTGMYNTSTTFNVELVKVVTLTVNVEQDALEFGYFTAFNEDGTYEYNALESYDAPYADGAYTVTAKVNQQLVMAVKEDQPYVFSTVEAVDSEFTFDHVAGASQVLLSTEQFNVDTTFEVTLQEVRTATVVLNDSEYFSRVNFNGTLVFTDNQATIDLLNAETTTLEVETAAGYALASIVVGNNVVFSTEEDEDLTTTSYEVDLADVANGTIIRINAAPVRTSVEWTFLGVEGLVITHNNVEATYADGVYTLSNITAADLDYKVNVAVAEEYAETLKITGITLNGEEVGTEDPRTGSYDVYSENLSLENLEFTVNTEEVAPATNRTISLQFNGTGFVDAFFVFAPSVKYTAAENSVEIPADAVAMLVVSTESGYKVASYQIGENEAVDVPCGENQTQWTLDLNAVQDGETVIVNIDEVSGIFSIFADEDGNIEIYNLNGVKVNDTNLAPGFYIVNGKKVYKK